MPKTQLQKKQQASPKRILSAVVAIAVAFFLLSSVIGLAEKYAAIHKRVRSLKLEQTGLEEKKATLAKTNDYIETPEGREREFRLKYNVVRPGEGMVVITEPKDVHAPTGPSSRVGRWWDSLLRGLGVRNE